MNNAIPPETKLTCSICKKTKTIDNFGWSKRKRRPTKACKACWQDPLTTRNRMANESPRELILYYSRVRSLMERLAEEAKRAADNGEPLERKIPNLAEIFVSEMTEEAYKGILRALITKADDGDVNAAKLLLEERHRRAGEPTPESVEEAWDDLFRVDPLVPGLDTA